MRASTRLATSDGLELVHYAWGEDGSRPRVDRRATVQMLDGDHLRALGDPPLAASIVELLA